MVLLRDLNKHAYPGTKFLLDAKKDLWIDLNIKQSGRKIAPVKLGSLEEISSEDYETSPLYEHEQTKSLYNFIKNALQDQVDKRDEAIKQHIRQYPNAQSFKNKLPPEVKIGKKEKDSDLVINSNNKIVKQNLNGLNRYLFNFITDLAIGEIDIEQRVKPRDLLKILNQKRPITQFNQKRENQFALKAEVNTLAKDFNERLDDLVKNEKFLNFIRDNKSPVSLIINTPNKDRAKLIELAEKRLAGRKELKDLKGQALMQYKAYTKHVAENILSIALNKINKPKRDKELSGVLQSLLTVKSKDGNS
ncbi:MAG: hypothetical protein LBR70_03515 [Lactobacillaceae bacterium]|jgi:hypothetical protein|nr:hypothetical protein [Lactobacillaceae bacterium]